MGDNFLRTKLFWLKREKLNSSSVFVLFLIFIIMIIVLFCFH